MLALERGEPVVAVLAGLLSGLPLLPHPEAVVLRRGVVARLGGGDGEADKGPLFWYQREISCKMQCTHTAYAAHSMALLPT